MDRDPEVSVCVPTYNGAAHLGGTLDSILAQSFEDFELVIIDDGSTDATLDLVATYTDPRLRVLRNESNQGPEATWNRCLAEARGEFIKLAPQDDLLYRTCLEQQVDSLRSHPGASFAAGKRNIIDEQGRVLFRGRGLNGLEGLVPALTAIGSVIRAGSNPIGEGGAVLMRRSAIQQAGGFDAAKPYVIDLEYWCRLLGVGDMVAVGETVSAFRVSSRSWSARLAGEQAREVRALMAELRDRYPTAVGRIRYFMGWVAAGAMARIRQIIYRLMALRRPSSS